MSMKIKEVADLVGISVRTLHHYDEIGLLTPDDITASGYRMYSQENLQELQQILFFRELGFPLKKIKEIIQDPTFDKTEALKLQRKMLTQKKIQLEQLIETIDKTILNMKGKIEMTNQDKFKGFDFSKNPYEAEARERWGDKAVDQSNAKINSKSNLEVKDMEKEVNTIYERLANVRHEKPDSDIAQQYIHDWYTFLQKVGSYSPEAFKNLGEMYVSDERFTKNIDQFGDGLAEFMRDAMRIYAERLN
ncbi:MerR family transcriptional regulator [Oceanobacillus sp. CAU 1775]